jgi:predicted nucleotidyltransferase
VEGAVIPEEAAQALADLADILEDLHLEWVLLGGITRDICFPGSKNPRKTRDLDTAVVLSDWEHLEHLFEETKSLFEVYRKELFLRHRVTRVKIDIVPTGGVEDTPGELQIPGSERVLNTVGLREAIATARSTEVAPGLWVPVVRPVAFAVLKVFSYLDREAPRDLRDLGHALATEIEDRLVILDDPVALEALDADLEWETASAYLLGRSAHGVFEKETLDHINQAIERLLKVPEHLIVALVSGEHLSPDEKPERARDLLRAFRLGMTGKSVQQA